MKVSCIQMNVVLGDVDANLATVETALKSLDQGTEVVVLPELFTTDYALKDIKSLAKKTPAALERLSALAKTFQIELIGGSLPTLKGEEVFNTLYVFDKTGEIIHTYDKVHLFRLMDEEKYLSEGKTGGMFTLNNLPQSAVICYDLRFPEWISAQMKHNANILYVVAEWPIERLAHWRHLLIARAIENQVFVVSCNRVGDDLKHTFAGHSMIVDPWGKVIAEGDEMPGIISSDLDVRDVDKIRKDIPISEDRRPHLYQR